MTNKEIIEKTEKKINAIARQLLLQRNDKLEGKIIGMKWVLHLLWEETK